MARILLISIILALFAVFTTASNSACQKRGGSTAPLAARACHDEVHDLTARTEECDDPCDEDCILGKWDDEPELRIIHGNASVPWEEGEVARIHVLSARGNDVLVFNCKDMPDVCQNMCYGISCARLPDTLTKNTGKRGTSQYKACTAARTKNLCGVTPHNRCSTSYKGTTRFPKRAGLSCDEYPFASTEEGQGTKGNHKAVTRCVPAKENSRQGGKISGVYRGLANGKEFDVRFDFGKGAIAAGDTGGQGYCAPAAQRNCNNLANDPYQEDD